MAKQTIIKIPEYRAKSRNQTVTAHWTKYKKARDEVKQLVSFYCKNRSQIDIARVTITAFFKGKRSIDTSNIDDKIWIDALMDIGILKNDTPIENPEVVKKTFINCGFDAVEIKIEEI